MKGGYLILVILMTICISIRAQTDNISWTGIKIEKPISSKWGFAALPILRRNQNFSNHQNLSIDLSLRYNINSHFFTQIVSRTWFVPDAPDRQFAWFDIGHKQSFKNFPSVWTNRLRWHMALDFNDQSDTDFLRYLSQYRLTNKGFIHPLFGLEFWWKVAGSRDLRVIRIEPGVRFDLSDTANIQVMWRRQNLTNREKPRGDNLWVLTYSIRV